MPGFEGILKNVSALILPTQTAKPLAGWLIGIKCFSLPLFCSGWGALIFHVHRHTQYVWRYLGCVVWLGSMMWGFWVFSFAFYVIKGKETSGYSCWHDQKEWIWLIVLWFPFLYISPTLSILLLFWSKRRTCMLCNAFVSFSGVLVCSSIVPSLARMQI